MPMTERKLARNPMKGIALRNCSGLISLYGMGTASKPSMTVNRTEVTSGESVFS